MEILFSCIADLARGKPRGKIPDLKRASHGKVTPHRQFLLKRLPDHLAHLEEQIARFSERIAEALRPFVDETTFERLDKAPGFNRPTSNRPANGRGECKWIGKSFLYRWNRGRRCSVSSASAV